MKPFLYIGIPIVIIYFILVTRMKTVSSANVQDAFNTGKDSINNAGNIRTSSERFRGEIDSPSNEFKSFDTITNGVRAIFVVIRTYMNKYQMNTVREIISRYAPSNENDTNNYVSFIESETGINPDQKLSFYESGRMLRLVRAMCKMENGLKIDDYVLSNAYNSVD